MRFEVAPVARAQPKKDTTECVRLPVEPKLLGFVLVDLCAGRPILDKARDIDRAAFTTEGGEPSIRAYVNFKSAGLFACQRDKRI